jgi:predicted nuclease of predicted toxin-antitoxin system
MAGILRGADVKVEVHDQHLAQDAPDPEWLAFAGKNNWIVITRDERIRYRVAEKQAIRRAKVRAFVLAAQGNLRAETLAENFLKRYQKFGDSLKRKNRLSWQRFHVAAMLTCCSSDPAYRLFALQLPFPESGRSGSSALQFVGA